MKVVMTITGGVAILKGVGWGVNGSDLLFHKGTEQECREAARNRRLTIDEMEKTPYHRDFKKTTFDIGDTIYYVHVDISASGFDIKPARYVDLKSKACGDRVHNGGFYAKREASDEVGLYQNISSSSYQKGGHFYCSNNEHDIVRLRANIHTWVNEQYKEWIADTHKLVNGLKLQQMAAHRECAQFNTDNKDVLNGIS